MTTKIDRTFHLTRSSAWAASGGMTTMVIATRHEIVGAGIEALLQAAGHIVVARCSREDDLLRSLEAYRPDILILAQNIVRQEGRETVLRLRASNRFMRIIFLLDERDAITTTDLLDVHVEAILLSATCARSLIECVASVHHGRKWIDPELLRELATAEGADAGGLTPREADVAYRVAQGLSNKEIARELHLSVGTVKVYLHHVYEKLHLGGRTQLALSMARASAQLPGYEVCLPREPACPDSAAALRLATWCPPKNPENAPGHIVGISLSGIKTGSTYTFQVRDLPHAPSANGEVDAYKPFTVTDGGEGDLDRTPNGQIVTTWIVHHDQDPVNAPLSLTATGNDGTMVSTTFADAPGRSLARPAFSNRTETAPMKFAPKGTPKPSLDKLTDALDRALDDDIPRKRLLGLVNEIPDKASRSQQPLADLVKRWTRIIKAAGVGG